MLSTEQQQKLTELEEEMDQLQVSLQEKDHIIGVNNQYTLASHISTKCYQFLCCC
jgi:hypothetical protein